MSIVETSLSDWNKVLPERFEFYHLGEVASHALPDESEERAPDTLAMGYQIQGDIQALILVLFDKGLDISVYSELGNVLASQIATQLHVQRGIDVMISPPILLNDAQFEKINRSQKPLVRKTYAHLCNNAIIPVEAWVLQALPEGVGHA